MTATGGWKPRADIRYPSLPRRGDERAPLLRKFITGIVSGPSLLLASTLLIAVTLSFPLPFPPGVQVSARPPQSTPAVENADGASSLVSMDRAVNLVLKIASRQFESRDEVATERILRDFDAVASRLEDVDLKGLKLLHRREKWVQVEAPFFAWEGGVGGTARLSFVERDGLWKLDRLKLIPWSET